MKFQKLYSDAGDESHLEDKYEKDHHTMVTSKQGFESMIIRCE